MGSKHDVHFSSDEEDCETPQDLFDALHREFRFTLDVCCTPDNAKVDRFYTKLTDGLRLPWKGEACWCNPPYGRKIGLWTRRAVAHRDTARTVLLLPARTDTLWWLHLVQAASEVRFLVGRLRFGMAGSEAVSGAPFPSAIVVVDSSRKLLKVGWFSLDAGAIIKQV